MTLHQKLLVVALFVILIVGGAILVQRSQHEGSIIATSTDSMPSDTTDPNAQTLETVIFKKVEGKEANFESKYVVMDGNDTLAKAVNAYISQHNADFKKDADSEVPALRKENASSASYSLIIDGKGVESDTTRSAVLSQYIYTGGANGSGSYKTFTTRRSDGELITLSDIVAPAHRQVILNAVLDSLKALELEDGTAIIEELALSDVTFDSLSRWALSNDSLNVYFDEYEIAPGAVGPVEVSIPLAKVSQFLTLN